MESNSLIREALSALSFLFIIAFCALLMMIPCSLLFDADAAKSIDPTSVQRLVTKVTLLFVLAMIAGFVFIYLPVHLYLFSSSTCSKTIIFSGKVLATVLDALKHIVVFALIFLLLLILTVVVTMFTHSRGTLPEGYFRPFVSVEAGISALLVGFSFFIRAVMRISGTIRVVNKKGERISLFRSLFRQIFKLFSAATLGLGFLMAALPGRKRSLHDVMSGGIVISDIKTTVPMVRISSKTAYYRKRTFPVVWTVLLILMFYIIISNVNAGRGPRIYEIVVPAGFWLFGFWKMRYHSFDFVDEVYDSRESLLLKGSGLEDSIPYQNISHIHFSRFTSRISLALIEPSKFGSEIEFNARTSLLPFRQHPSITKLIERINASKINT